MLTRTLVHAFLVAAVAVVGSPGARAGDVRIAERPNVGPFTTIQDGVNAALEGESLLVVPGPYAPFVIDGKSVHVFSHGAAQATITGQVIVRNLALGQSVLLHGLDVTSTLHNTVVTLDVANVQGHLRVQRCGFFGSYEYGDPNPGVRVTNSVNVVFSDCTLLGGNGASAPSFFPFDGGPGLESTFSAVAAYGTLVRGGTGSTTTDPRGGHGGSGYSGRDLGLFASGCIFQGGNGGDGDWPPNTVGGTGGTAFVIDSAQGFLLDCATLPGTGGLGGTGIQAPAGATVQQLNGAITHVLPGSARRLSAAAVTSDDVSVGITVQGQPGDIVYLVMARRPAFTVQISAGGVWMVPQPAFTSALPLGTVGPSGTLVVQRSFGIPDGTVAARLFWLQAICVDPAGQRTLTGPAHVLSLE